MSSTTAFILPYIRANYTLILYFIFRDRSPALENNTQPCQYLFDTGPVDHKLEMHYSFISKMIYRLEEKVLKNSFQLFHFRQFLFAQKFFIG